MIMFNSIELNMIKGQISVKLSIGEIRIGIFNFIGVRYTMDHFCAPYLLSLTPPVADMKENGVKIARVYSCPVKEGIKRISIKNNYLCYIDELYKYYYVDTKGSFKDYSTSKKKIIKDIKRCIRKIESVNNGNSYFITYSSPDEIDVFINYAIKISRKTYQHLLLKEGIPDTVEFKKNMIERSKKGELFGYILMIKEKPVAYNLCPVYGKNKVLYDYSGYDPEYKDYSPGTVLHFKVIEDLFNRQGLDFYDLCTGEGTHKKMFSTGYILCGDIYYCSLFSRYIGIIFIKIILKIITEKTKNILDFFELRGKAKKKIREIAMWIRRNDVFAI